MQKWWFDDVLKVESFFFMFFHDFPSKLCVTVALCKKIENGIKHEKPIMENSPYEIEFFYIVKVGFEGSSKKINNACNYVFQKSSLLLCPKY